MDHLSIAPEKPAQLFRRPPLRPGDQLRTLNYDDLDRWRVSVFFRLFMAIPHLLWLSIWGSGMVLISPILWIVAVFTGKPPDGLRDVYAMWIRYAVHVYAFLYLAANPFPGFLGKPKTYPIEVEIPPAAEHQNRASVFFRFFLAFPPLMLAAALVGFGGGGGNTGSGTGGTGTSDTGGEGIPIWLTVLLNTGGGIVATGALLAWFAALARGRMPQGIRDLIVWALGYAAQVYAYLFLVTPRYPNSDPALAPLAPLPDHPVRMRNTDKLRRNRWTVAFRFILAMPHFIWLLLWTLVVVVSAIITWLATLILGRSPRGLHNFHAAYVRYTAHVWAFNYLGAGPFPGFAGAPKMYPVDIEIDEPERHNRWTVLFRGLLAFPAFLLSSAVGGAALFAAIGSWFYSLVKGRAPEGLRNVVDFGARYNAQLYAYMLFVTPRYPYSGPADYHR